MSEQNADNNGGCVCYRPAAIACGFTKPSVAAKVSDQDAKVTAITPSSIPTSSAENSVQMTRDFLMVHSDIANQQSTPRPVQSKPGLPARQG